MIAERRAGAQKCLQVLPIRAGHLPRRVRNTGDLVKVTADGTELRHGSLELGELAVRNPCNAPQVGSKHNRGIRGGGHSSGHGALPQQHVVIRSQAHE